MEKLQSLVQEAADRFGNLEQKYETEKEEHKEELKLELVTGQVEELREARRRQETMVKFSDSFKTSKIRDLESSLFHPDCARLS